PTFSQAPFLLMYRLFSEASLTNTSMPSSALNSLPPVSISVLSTRGRSNPWLGLLSSRIASFFTSDGLSPNFSCWAAACRENMQERPDRMPHRAADRIFITNRDRIVTNKVTEQQERRHKSVPAFMDLFSDDVP